jgi:hypothetical protein
MDPIDASLRSLDDSLTRLAERLRSTEGEAVRLFRARSGIDEIQARLAAARANGDIGPGWGGGHVDGVNRAAMLVAAVRGEGGSAFDAAMKATSETIAELDGAIPS